MRRQNTNDTPWISLADMMTALMVIFMFIAISFILRVLKIEGYGDINVALNKVDSLTNVISFLEGKVIEKDSIINEQGKVVDNYLAFQNEVFNSLKNEFKDEETNGRVEILKDGSIRFNTKKGTNLFAINKDELSNTFKKELDNFIPRYWNVIDKDKFKDYIKEIRIEGHADTIPPSTKRDDYLYNLDLSSKRAASVLAYIRDNEVYKTKSKSEKRRMDFLFTAVGFSFSRALNDDKEFIYTSNNKKVNNDLSRRVEFRIITSSEKLINTLKQKEPLNQKITKPESYDLKVGDFFGISYNAYSNDSIAIAQMNLEKKRSNLDMGYLWMKDYKSLGNKELYLVYYGPYYSEILCKKIFNQIEENEDIKGKCLLISKTADKYAF